MDIDLNRFAREAMTQNGLLSDFDAAAKNVIAHLPAQAPMEPGVRDLRGLLWSSIDNRESRDLDQIEVVEELPGGETRVLVGIADVDELVKKNSPVDRHAFANTCSVYTGVVTFPMLPEVLSTGLTSLNEDAERMAIVIAFIVDAQGDTRAPEVYRAQVKNHARLTYTDVAAWLDGNGPAPERVGKNPTLQQQLRAQDAAAARLRKRRQERGALELETIEARPVTQDGHVTGLELSKKNRARDLIEDFMVAANSTMARFLDSKGVASLRRVVKEPKRWDRIVAIAAERGVTLPATPSSRALADFLASQRQKDALHFADLSLAVVKLMGPGEYAVEKPGQVHDGHFGLAVQDYTHSTAPNRRFADLVTQRLLKACEAGQPPPYTEAELTTIAARCTQKANDAQKVERLLRKVAAALFLSAHIGESYDAIVTGAAEKGIFVRLLSPPAEGRVIQGEQGLDVGQKIRVKLLATDARKGFIDFARV
jgi:VacB/RNase II family 3'-5' exoribonuclease